MIVIVQIGHCCHLEFGSVDFVVCLVQDLNLAGIGWEKILQHVSICSRNKASILPPSNPTPLALGVVSRSSCVDCVKVCCRSGELTSLVLFLRASAGDDL